MICMLMLLVFSTAGINPSHAINTRNSGTIICKSLLFLHSMYQSEVADSVISDSINDTAPEESETLVFSDEVIEDIMDDQFDGSSDDTVETMLSSSIPAAETTKFPFYRRWWFALLILFPVFLIIRRHYLRKEKDYNNIIEKKQEEIESINEQLHDTENYFEKAQKEQAERLEGEKELRYHAEGISKFSDIMSKNKSNTSVLGQKIVSELVSFVGANAGAMYLFKEDNNEESLLEFFGGFAPDLKQIKASFKKGEGYVGACFEEGKTMELSNTQESFIKVYSGLGEASPGYLVFVPLMQDEFKVGVIEIASFRKLDDYKIRFIESLSENIASTLALNQANEKMQLMLEQSKVQAKDLQTREEELRQNLEEMHATQEDLNRQMENNQKMQESLVKEKALLDSLMGSLPDYIYFKDLNSKFIRISKSMLQLYDVKDVEEMIGKSDFDFKDDEAAKKYYNEEMEIIKTGKGFVDKVTNKMMDDGKELWSSTSKMPLYDETGKCIGTFGITKNITDLKKLEMDAKERAEQLLSQEEELRQNIEEMQAIQDELQKQKEELEKEKYLMEALMDNVPEFIYFKDLKSKFIRNSTSHAIQFGFSNGTEISGKSDFDFFADEHARPAYNIEQEIIRTGKPIINRVEKKVRKDGSISWVSTSKMPLKNKQGKIVGTFGISKDITDIKNMELEIKQRLDENEKMKNEFRQKETELKKSIQELRQKLKKSGK